MQVKKQQLELDMEQRIGSKLGKEYVKAVYCHAAYLTSLQSAVLCWVAQSCPTLCNPMDCSPPGSSVHEEFSRQEYWSRLPCPPPGDLPNLGIKPRSPFCRQILYHLSHKGSPGILERVAYPFSRGSCPPRNGTRVSRIARGFSSSWATREALYAEYIMLNAGLNESKGGIKVAKRNINNLRYEDNTTLMAKSEEELKSLLMKEKK